MRPSTRAQSTVVGIALLFGLVAVGSIGLLAVGGQTIADAEYQAEQERIEQSFVELSHSMATVADDGEMPRQQEFDAGESGAITKTEAGWINISADGVQENLTMGAIEYRSDGGGIVAYQAGGVWRERGDETRMLSAPPVHYDPRDETLTLPVTTLADDEKDLSTGSVTIEHKSTDPVEDAEVVENDTIELEIQSDYYRGWEYYFRTQAGDASIKDVRPDDRTVVVELGHIDLEGAFDQGATYSDRVDEHPGNEIEEDASYGSMPPMDEVIDDIVQDIDDGEMSVDQDLGTVSGGQSLAEGTYVADEITAGGHLDFDLTGGNATLVVRGDIDADGDTITVSDYDEGNELKIYVTGDYDASNGGNVCVDPCYDDVSAKIIQMYGKSTMQIDFGPGGSSRYEGVLYAASNEDSWGSRAGSCDDSFQAAIQSNPNFYGSLVAASICGQSAAMDFDYDEELSGEDFDAVPDDYVLPPQITYLNVAVYELDVSN